MSPIQGYYTSPDALQLIKDALPDEDPEEFLLAALRNDQVWWWLLDGSGKRWDLPIPYINVEGLHHNLQEGTVFFERMEQHPGEIQMDDMLSSCQKNSLDEDRTVGGTFQICKEGLDHLLFG